MSTDITQHKLISTERFPHYKTKNNQINSKSISSSIFHIDNVLIGCDNTFSRLFKNSPASDGI